MSGLKELELDLEFVVGGMSGRKIKLCVFFSIKTRYTTSIRMGKEKLVKMHVKGYISSPHSNSAKSTGSGSDRQFIYVNSRPTDSPKILKCFTDVFRSFSSSNGSPIVVIDFILPTDSYDVNVSPDKRTLLIHSEWKLVDALKVQFFW